VCIRVRDWSNPVYPPQDLYIIEPRLNPLYPPQGLDIIESRLMTLKLIFYSWYSDQTWEQSIDYSVSEIPCQFFWLIPIKLRRSSHFMFHWSLCRASYALLSDDFESTAHNDTAHQWIRHSIFRLKIMSLCRLCAVRWFWIDGSQRYYLPVNSALNLQVKYHVTVQAMRRPMILNRRLLLSCCFSHKSLAYTTAQLSVALFVLIPV
jgi:hypothetical protein